MDLSFLNADEIEQLAGTLGVPEEELHEAIEKHAAAAAEEYIRMFLGQRVFTRGSDIREYRLLLLIKHAFGGRIPSEADVSRLFQTTHSQSRSLIASVMSKFQYEIRRETDDTLRGVIEAANEQEDGHDYDVVIDSDNLVAELNKRIQGIDGTLPAIHKKRGTASTYVLPVSSYLRLRESLEI